MSHDTALSPVHFFKNWDHHPGLALHRWCCFYLQTEKETGDELHTRGQPCWTARWKEQLYRRYFPFLIRAPSPPVTPPLRCQQASQMMAS
ncbi:hypothetical protein GOODEAATRI_011447 [Goodea atripinnis]|uniref:Uncharacterized protein n=1 Tax=Goodea atripinnis TaxID=208336 RepID=A0ABV0NAS4_9TELE